jgi:hypothetical protein
MNVFGVPLWVLGIGCLAVAAIYIIYWPRPRTAGRMTRVVLRWFHGLVWLLLGLAAFVAPQAALGGTTTATAAALLALLCYMIFMVELFRDRLARVK